MQYKHFSQRGRLKLMLLWSENLFGPSSGVQLSTSATGQRTDCRCTPLAYHHQPHSFRGNVSMHGLEASDFCVGIKKENFCTGTDSNVLMTL